MSYSRQVTDTEQNNVTKYYIGVNATEHVSETSEPDPNDRWDRASTCTDWTINGIKVSRKEGYQLLPIEIDAGHPVYVVYAIWSTGDSFGHDENYGCEAMAVLPTREEADKEVARLKEVKDYSVPWNGYFESLTTIDIVSGIV